ncbi:hypothetical protein FDJ20_gp087 [Vibrio phage Thalassa]|uniref:Uncharacterized protein n=1 Tax=Vibrio phage Thalassa TaxID=2570301 RepID=A0A2H5BH42_9CAUD|nr:hypothetical protein FDJ20_gp087 [Vibrio phage Thalassa]AUG85289.1 hypothetical protein THALASSA_87 [Vibrio phage Thalassa]
MILKEDNVVQKDGLMHFTVYHSRIDFGVFKKGDEVFVYKTIEGLGDLQVHKAVPLDTDQVHYFFDHELDLEQ